jgi:hypothetical protein
LRHGSLLGWKALHATARLWKASFSLCSLPDRRARASGNPLVREPSVFPPLARSKKVEHPMPYPAGRVRLPEAVQMTWKERGEDSTS